MFCETVCGRPLTAQQRALAEALLANPHGLSLLRTARQGSRSFIQKLHERFMQGRRADLLIVDDVASSTEAAKLPIENNMSNEAEQHSWRWVWVSDYLLVSENLPDYAPIEAVDPERGFDFCRYVRPTDEMRAYWHHVATTHYGIDNPVMPLVLR